MVDPTTARKNINRRYEAKNRRSIELFNEATKDAVAIRRLIESKYRPQRIYQWGSLLHPERFDENSDIDFAVEGITAPETFFSMLGDAMKLTRLPLDIVQIEKIEIEFADAIRQSGMVVYERA
jgi:predicted nucleotidyltransferase